MILKKKDKAVRLLQLVTAGLISIEQYRELISKAKKNTELGSHLMWTFSQFTEMSNLRSDLELVKYVLKINDKDILRITTNEYLSALKFASEGLADISNAIKKIQFPPMSAEKKQAGFDKLDFGDLGMARMIGEFEKLNTLQAYDLPMHFVIKSLDQMAGLRWCEHRHTEILTNKSKVKNGN